MAIQEEVEANESSCCYSPLTVGLAISGSKSSKYAVQWALKNFGTKGKAQFKLIHILPKITMVPTPMGNCIPIDKVRSDIADAYEKDIEFQAEAMLLFYKKMCDEKKVEVEVLVIKGDDVAEAISNAVSKYQICKLVVGTSAWSTFMIRKLKGNRLSSRICESVPSFCTTYVVSKGGLSSVYSAGPANDESATLSRTSDGNSNTKVYSDDMSPKSDMDNGSESKLFESPSLLQPSSRNQSFSPSKYSRFSCDLHANAAIAPSRSGGYDASFRSNLSWENFDNSSTDHDRCRPSYEHLTRSASVSTDDKNRSSTTCASGESSGSNNLFNSDKAPVLNCLQGPLLSGNKVDMSSELEKLRIELRHIQGVYKFVQDESVDASQQMNELAVKRMEEEARLREVNSRLDRANDTARQEKAKRDAAEREASHVRELVKEEALRKHGFQLRAFTEATRKQRLEKLLARDGKSYSTFTWEEMESATSSFSDTLKIGAGANGTVYKGHLHHTAVAIKVLHSSDGHMTKHFNQELEILGKIHHPHLLLLLGACPARGCLVYEYMENGSLDDRLQCKDGTPPLPWFYRYRIAWEIASALVVLHNTKPEPIIHRDLKPANILLDSNFISKIGDVGLSTLLPFKDYLSTCTMYKDTSLVGTFFYMDPEYQRTGQVSPKSDTYALGMVILQLLTAKSPMGLADLVERALEDRRLPDILDQCAGNWPVQETHGLARLGLRCLEMRRRDRPDLKCQVLAVLERLKHTADTACNPVQHAPTVPPSHFICPLLKRVMQDPCIASDGYSYDRNAIEMWLCDNDTSPVSNVPLPNKDLVPNHSLLCAIRSWKSGS